MSTVMMAPEDQSFRLDPNEPEMQQPMGHLWSPQVACALLLVLTDVVTIALSLGIAVLARFYWLPRVNSDLSVPALSFWNHIVAAWDHRWLVSAYIYSATIRRGCCPWSPETCSGLGI